MLAVASLASALCVAIMALGTFFEVMDISLAILAGLIVCVLSLEFGVKWGLAVFLVGGLLSLLLPRKDAGIIFLLFCGWYPVAQKKIQLLKPLYAWIIKEAAFNVVLAAYLFIAIRFLGLVEEKWITVLTAVFANILFILYDVLLDRFQIYYILKLRDRIGMNKFK